MCVFLASYSYQKKTSTDTLQRRLVQINHWQVSSQKYRNLEAPTTFKVWNTFGGTWRIIPGLVSVVNWPMVNKSPFSRVVGPLPNGRAPWLIDGGDPNHLQVHLRPSWDNPPSRESQNLFRQPLNLKDFCSGKLRNLRLLLLATSSYCGFRFAVVLHHRYAV